MFKPSHCASVLDFRNVHKGALCCVVTAGSGRSSVRHSDHLPLTRSLFRKCPVSLLVLNLSAFFQSQEAGEILFVPSGWHHSVMNLAETLSINHNWINAFNVHWTWALLARQRDEAADAIEDCRWALLLQCHGNICRPPSHTRPWPLLAAADHHPRRRCIFC